MDMQDRRKSRRFAVTKPVLCSRFGKQMTMRTLDISRGGLKLEANFDLEVGESMDLAILTNGTRIRCKGKILAIEELGYKVQARLCFASPSTWEYGKLFDYLRSLSPGRKIPMPKWVTVEWARDRLGEISSTFAGIMVILYFGIHIWTIWISFSATGIIGALVTLATPIVSQVFWFIIIWVHADTLFNPYCVSLIAYIAAWAVYIQRRRGTKKRIS